MLRNVNIKKVESRKKVEKNNGDSFLKKVQIRRRLIKVKTKRFKKYIANVKNTTKKERNENMKI